MSDTVSLIIALKGCDNIETDGCIIRLGNGASTNTVRNLASQKLGLLVPLEDLILETSDGKILNDIDRVISQRIIYISLKERIKDVIPGPRRLPMVGNLYDMMPDL
jgi:cytochrome P450/NADPH-cytochrome P450 reductase